MSRVRNQHDILRIRKTRLRATVDFPQPPLDKIPRHGIPHLFADDKPHARELTGTLLEMNAHHAMAKTAPVAQNTLEAKRIQQSLRAAKSVRRSPTATYSGSRNTGTVTQRLTKASIRTTHTCFFSIETRHRLFRRHCSFRQSQSRISPVGTNSHRSLRDHYKPRKNAFQNDSPVYE